MSAETKKPTVKIPDFLAVRERQPSHLSQEDQEFWNNNPPEEIIIATGSIRKAIMAIQLMQGFVFTYFDEKNPDKSDKLMDEPLELQVYFDQNIHNGDGHLKVGEKILLGYYHGVPVHVENGNGESPNNDPIEQAEKKAVALARHYQTKGREVLIVSTDTVDRPDISDVPLGKPMNEADFPGRDDFASDEAYESAVAGFKRDYVQKYYHDGTSSIHTNGVAVVRTFSDGRQPQLLSDETVLKIAIRQQMIDIFVDCAGGAVFQQLIEWHLELEDQLDADELFEAVEAKFGDRLQQLMSEMLEQDDSDTSSQIAEYKAIENLRAAYLKWTVFCQISGMPWWFIDETIQEFVAREREKVPSHQGWVELHEGEQVMVSRFDV